MRWSHRSRTLGLSCHADGTSQGQVSQPGSCADVRLHRVRRRGLIRALHARQLVDPRRGPDRSLLTHPGASVGVGEARAVVSRVLVDEMDQAEIARLLVPDPCVMSDSMCPSSSSHVVTWQSSSPSSHPEPSSTYVKRSRRPPHHVDSMTLSFS